MRIDIYVHFLCNGHLNKDKVIQQILHVLVVNIVLHASVYNQRLIFTLHSKGTKYSPRALDKRLWRARIYRAYKTFLPFFEDWRNIMEILAVVCTVLIIPCRVVDTNWQWRVAALAFIFHGLRMFEYAVLWP